MDQRSTNKFIKNVEVIKDLEIENVIANEIESPYGVLFGLYTLVDSISMLNTSILQREKHGVID